MKADPNFWKLAGEGGKYNKMPLSVSSAAGRKLSQRTKRKCLTSLGKFSSS